MGWIDRSDWVAAGCPKWEASCINLTTCPTAKWTSFMTKWWQRPNIATEEDSIHQLGRAAQVTIFRLGTGHCQLLSHLHRLKISHSDECPCGTGPHSPLPTTSCSPALPSTCRNSRHNPVRWMPTGSSGDGGRHCRWLQVLPCSLDWKSSRAGPWDTHTADDCRFCLAHWTENLAGPDRGRHCSWLRALPCSLDWKSSRAENAEEGNRRMNTAMMAFDIGTFNRDNGDDDDGLDGDGEDDNSNSPDACYHNEVMGPMCLV